ncbi:MAG: hypothetical protein KDC07_12040 [Chitinophagaceae bacterium]|nr:hypothetical protein [Chitinophagaceae bacterium]MCB9045670.1 hypothetical protein [Chitinophagales bacterium]
MIRRYLLFTTIMIGAPWFAWLASAQDESDALRYSMLSPQGTARSIGFGGALGAIGGDFSALSVNPAGIGVYRSSELTFTPSLKMNGTNSTYTGAATVDNSTRFNINNLGVVFTSAATGRRYKKSKWKAASFGFGVNRVADFSSNHVYSGFNNTSSASEVFLADAIAYPDDYNNLATFAGMGYNAFLLDYNDSIGYTKTPTFSTGLNQMRKVEQKGGITDVNFSFGGNYEEKLMLGATIGIPSLRYIRNVTLREEDASGNPDNDFDYFEYTESLKTTGTGLNMKLGFIYNFTNNFRAGAAFHTPTYFALSDVQNRSLVSNTENFKSVVNPSDPNPYSRVDAPTNEYQYSLITPWKTVLSAAGIIGKHGFISVDYEYVDYASAKFNFDNTDNYYENEVNSGIKSMYKGASNLRIGGEARFDMLMLRLGFGYYGNPYRTASNGSETMNYSAGVGFRFDDVFIDLGFNHSTSTVKEQPYAVVYPNEVIDVPKATIKNSFNNLALTVGFKF